MQKISVVTLLAACWSVAALAASVVSNGEMSFVVEVDDVAVAKGAVRELVEVKATLEVGDWGKPSDGEIRFMDCKVVVAPNRGGSNGFVRVRIPAQK